jgi:hypothetical protein
VARQASSSALARGRYVDDPAGMPETLAVTLAMTRSGRKRLALGTEARFSGATLFPAGFLAACYFLKFRNILPLTAIHAIAFVLLSNWVDKHL